MKTPTALHTELASGLQEEIDRTRRTIHADAYSMSIGEVINMYRDGEINIHPDYQRLFRWTDEQKSKLVDSILLGIPIPSIFVAQGEDGVWEIIDGLQRICTILHLAGELKDPDRNQHYPPLVLKGTQYLPSLEGKCWSENTDDPNALSISQRLQIKRAKLDLKIILKVSDPKSKYDLFQRLNSGGTPLEPMEIRNCLIRMVNPEFGQWIADLAKDQDFLDTVDLSDGELQQLKHWDLVTRFLAFRVLPETELSGIGDVNEFLDERMVASASDPQFNREREGQAFRQTFSVLNGALGADAFRRYDSAKRRFAGQFLISAFEIIAIGLGYHMPSEAPPSPELIETIAKTVRDDSKLSARMGAGVRGNTRIRATIPQGRSLFQQPA